MNVFRRESIKTYLRHISISSERGSLKGRDFISPENFSSTELKTVMWTAKDFKTTKDKGKSQILQNINNLNATVIMNKPNINSQVIISNALSNLGCHDNIVIDDEWEKSSNIADLGRSLSKLTNIIITVGCQHDSVKTLSDGASVPVINFSSTSFQFIEYLANLLSVQEHYGFLRGLKIGWIGPCSATLNTIFYVSPKFEMNVQFTCAEEMTRDQQELLGCSIKNAVAEGSEIRQCLGAKEVIYRSHVIATSMHTCPELQITQKLLSDAAVNWTLLHSLPRSNLEVSDDVFCSKRSLVWNTYENVMWMMMAVTVHLLGEYQARSNRPDFEGLEVPAKKFYQY